MPSDELDSEDMCSCISIGLLSRQVVGSTLVRMRAPLSLMLLRNQKHPDTLET